MFLTAIVIDSLMRPEPRIYEQNVEKMIEDVSFDDQMSRLVSDKKIPNDLEARVISFAQRYISLSKKRYKSLIDAFFDEREFKPSQFKDYEKLNPMIKSHPAILWNLQQLKDGD